MTGHFWHAAPLKSGIYAGYGDMDLAAHRSEAHSSSAAARLADLRAKYDPNGLFLRYRETQRAKAA